MIRNSGKQLLDSEKSAKRESDTRFDFCYDFAENEVALKVGFPDPLHLRNLGASGGYDPNATKI